MHSRVTLTLILTFVAGCSKKNPEEQAMTPRESLAAMHVRGDFHVELFAAEPDVMSPVEMVFDENAARSDPKPGGGTFVDRRAGRRAAL